jgi:sulfide:quinone oxidoreductase
VTQTQFRQLADDFYVAPQLAAADFAAARALGIRTVINNRPDGEAADQLGDAEASAAAAAAGLAYAFVPVVSGSLRPEAVKDFQEAVARHPGPYLAYCRSGTRSCHVWALATAGRRPVEEILSSAAAAGYDLSPARSLLEHLARSR